MPTGQQFTNCVEFDNSTESIWSQKESHSIEMKMRKYLSDLAACNYAYRVQFRRDRSTSAEGPHSRRRGTVTTPIDFAPFYVVHLDDYLVGRSTSSSSRSSPRPKTSALLFYARRPANLPKQAVPVLCTTERQNRLCLTV